MIRVLEVIWIFDRRIHPENWKMAVCIQPDCGLFFRINSSDRYKPALKLVRDPYHLFLKHDSYIECSIPFDLDEYIIEQAVQKGIFGRVHQSLAASIAAEVQANETLVEVDKRAIHLALKQKA